jgi:type VI secretion system protein ImpL
MNTMRRLLANWWVLSSLTALVLIILVAFLLPRFVELSWGAELALIFLILLVLGAFAGWRIFQAQRASGRIERKLGIAAQPAESDSDVLARRMSDALAALKKDGGGRRDYLYSRPWYVMIGPPGAGKTTALLNSGLRFPSQPPGDHRAGGTRNIEFLFADEAVLLDTAGRYTSQDSDAARDREAWVQFLNLLKVNRPLQPVNGVIVAIGLDELAMADRQAIERHASIVETRLRELGDALGIEAPVYVLFTKTDLVAGFLEFCGDLDVEGRRAVLGATLPWSADTPPTPATIAENFDALMNAIDARTSKRLQDESDLRRRSLIVGFPAQIAGLRAGLLHFLELAFTQTRRRRPAALRGFYFTSGVQQGTPFDRLLGRVATLFDARAAAPGAGQGRAFFINRLLKDVVIGEAGLVRRTPAIRRKEKLTFIIGAAAIGLVCVLAVGLWTVSFFANRSWTSDLHAKADQAWQDLQGAGINLAEVRDPDLDIDRATQVLDELRNLPGGYAERHGPGHAFWAGFGLYESSVGEEAERAYIDTTQRILMPRALLRMEQRLRTGQADRFGLYDTLKAYLLAGGHAPAFDPAFVERWVSADWASNLYPGGDLQPARDRMRQHLHVMLNDSQFGRIWGDQGAILDGDLVKMAQASIQGLSMADRAYAILKQKAADAGPDWRASDVLDSGTAKAFANGEALRARSVPFFFTADGYTRVYLLGRVSVQRDLEKDSWMFGSDGANRWAPSTIRDIQQGLADDYARDYIAQWNGVIAALDPADYFHDPDALRVAIMPPSPIKRMLQAVAENTHFGNTASQVAGTIARRYLPGITSQVDSMHIDAPDTHDAAAQIEGSFSQLNQYVAAKAPPSLDDFLGKLGDAGNALHPDSSTLPVDPQMSAQDAGAARNLSDAARIAPPQLRAFMTAASTQSDSARASQTVETMSNDYAQNIHPACDAATAHRYPFVQDSAQDAAVADLLPVFGNAGLFDNFIKNDLHAFLEQSVTYWRWNAGNPVTANFGSETPSQLQKAQDLRDLLSTGVQAKIEVISFGGTVTAAELSVGGTQYRFEQGQAVSHQIAWNTNLQPEAQLSLFAGAQKVKDISGSPGTWALFHLFDAAKEEATGPYQFKATFGDGASFVVFRVTLVGAHDNVFSRAGLWSFRCPPRL